MITEYIICHFRNFICIVDFLKLRINSCEYNKQCKHKSACKYRLILFQCDYVKIISNYVEFNGVCSLPCMILFYMKLQLTDIGQSETLHTTCSANVDSQYQITLNYAVLQTKRWTRRPHSLMH
jgi:hypothetical protein